ncbi:hypothetical protein PG993_006345 [Apiospora rasikravindrae]|uniref:Fungal N-terminal domain-containing protein n=1 Tax=Apiospora rasikravindrae TaxID=990691 RepID=A0ABR1T5F6_9PEZI
MEALGAAGSIVGILGFIGQSVAGIVKLQAFFDGYKKAPQIAKTLQSDLTSLQATLTDVKAVVQHLENQSWGDIAEAVRANLANLTGFARQCSDDITSWVQVTAGLNPKHKSGFKSFFRTIKIALSGPDTLRSFESDLAKHRQNISNALARLTVNLVLKGHMSLEESSSKLDQFSDTQLKASEAIFDQLGHATVEHSAEIPDDSAEGSLAQLLQDVQVSLENRFDALSEVVGINQEQRDQEPRNLAWKPNEWEPSSWTESANTSLGVSQ